VQKADGSPNVGDEHRLQPAFYLLSELGEFPGLGKTFDIRLLLANPPLPFAAAHGDPAPVRTGFHRLNAGVAALSNAQSQTGLLQQAIWRVEIRRHQVKLLCFGSCKHATRFQHGSAAKREVELQLDLPRIDGFAVLRSHFASRFRIATNSCRRFALVLG
jgi:hypothetical protein